MGVTSRCQLQERDKTAPSTSQPHLRTVLRRYAGQNGFTHIVIISLHFASVHFFRMALVKKSIRYSVGLPTIKCWRPTPICLCVLSGSEFFVDTAGESNLHPNSSAPRQNYFDCSSLSELALEHLLEQLCSDGPTHLQNMDNVNVKTCHTHDNPS